MATSNSAAVVAGTAAASPCSLCGFFFKWEVGGGELAVMVEVAPAERSVEASRRRTMWSTASCTVSGDKAEPAPAPPSTSENKGSDSKKSRKLTTSGVATARPPSLDTARMKRCTTMTAPQFSAAS
ncbi:hypothetical protein NQL31_002523 [Lotmaria passim]